ncbi:MAG: transketolase-like TK C-terminal-containing protein [Bilophila wadsworthia]
MAWKVALESAQPSCMVLTRQGLTPQTRTEEQLEAVKRGAYILKDCEGTPEVILIALVRSAARRFRRRSAAGKGRKARGFHALRRAFDAQPAEYKENVLPRAVRARVAVEAASVDGWWKYVGSTARWSACPALASPPRRRCSSTSGSPSIMSLTLPKAI